MEFEEHIREIAAPFGNKASWTHLINYGNGTTLVVAPPTQ